MRNNTIWNINIEINKQTIWLEQYIPEKTNHTVLIKLYITVDVMNKKHLSWILLLSKPMLTRKAFTIAGDPKATICEQNVHTIIRDVMVVIVKINELMRLASQDVLW